MVFTKYIYNDTFKEEFLFCSSLETTTKAADILEKVSTVFQSEYLEWKNLVGWCTDSAPSMLGCHSGFQALVKIKAPKSRNVSCMLHRQVLAFKTLPNALQKVFDEMIQIVNFIKVGALNSRLFKKLSMDLDFEHLVLLYHTQIRWLSKGNVTRRWECYSPKGMLRFFELKDELKELQVR